MFTTELLDRYVAVWNEPDPDRRAADVAALWRPDGAHFTPMRDPVGHDAITTRIAGAYEQFVQPGEMAFRSAANLTSFHGMATFNWHMVRFADNANLAVGFDVILLDDDLRIITDYQFTEPPSPVPVLNTFTARYLETWNEPDPQRRLAAVTELWAPDGRYITAGGVAEGPAKIAEAIADESRDRTDLRSLDDAEGAHDGVRFRWESTEGNGFDFLVLTAPKLDGTARIATAYRVQL